jgi:hypothetical protein
MLVLDYKQTLNYLNMSASTLFIYIPPNVVHLQSHLTACFRYWMPTRKFERLMMKIYREKS